MPTAPIHRCPSRGPAGWLFVFAWVVILGAGPDALAGGVATAEGLVGTWAAEALDGEAVPEGVELTLVFKDDGTGTLSMGTPDFTETAMLAYSVDDAGRVSLTIERDGDSDDVLLESAVDDAGRLMLWEADDADAKSVFVRVEDAE